LLRIQKSLPSHLSRGAVAGRAAWQVSAFEENRLLGACFRLEAQFLAREGWAALTEGLEDVVSAVPTARLRRGRRLRGASGSVRKLVLGLLAYENATLPGWQIQVWVGSAHAEARREEPPFPCLVPRFQGDPSLGKNRRGCSTLFASAVCLPAGRPRKMRKDS
jgi:hypothetical protein